MSVITPQADLLAHLLDAAHLRHQAISQNLANVNTPGYRRLDVAFQDAFAREMQRHGEQGVAAVPLRTAEGPGGAERADGNNIDIDKELGALNQNAILFNVASQLLLSRLATMRSAITGR